ncbi:MAG TPA: type II secretion system protein GspC [Thermodesulfovibrionales bacterium]|nr:type II secretion system protein GspC [Thermodesulfovibrionales bacterium]
MGNFDIRPRYSTLLTIGNLFLGLLVLFFLLILVRDAMTIRYKRIEKTSPPSTATSFRRNNLKDYENILRNNPFGLPAASLIPLSASQEKAGASQTEMTLIGTISGQPRNSFAIFSDRTGMQEVYRVGDTIPGVGRLERVEKDRVSVKGAGRLLDMPIADILKITDVAPASAGARPSDFVRSLGGGSYVVDQRRVQQAIENPNQLMTDARLQPNIKDGKQEGFVLREVRDGGIYQSLGIQNGDILLRINDYNISNPESALQAFTALRGMDRIQLDIMRNGARTTLTYQIK